MAPSNVQILHPGDVIGETYVVEGCVGGGGMGQVFVARDRRLDRRVAIKLWHTEVGQSDAASARFEREARMLSRVVHPNVVAIYDYGQRDGAWYIVMELVDGLSLGEWLAKHGPLSLDDTLTVTRQVASSLAEAHALGIIHRDIKPGNILLRRLASGGLVTKVVDFGLARAFDEGSDITAEQTVLGTPYYMSPEQIQCTALDGRSDLYSLAIVVFEMITGRVPFRRDTMQGTLIAHLVEVPPPLNMPLRSGGIPPEFELELHRAMAKAPEDRHGDMMAFARALAAAVGVEAAADVGTARCDTCDGSVRAGDVFCRSCGAPQALEACAQCGAPREGKRLACGACGAALVVTGRHGGGQTPGSTEGETPLCEQPAVALVARV